MVSFYQIIVLAGLIFFPFIQASAQSQPLQIELTGKWEGQRPGLDTLISPKIINTSSNRVVIDYMIAVEKHAGGDWKHVTYIGATTSCAPAATTSVISIEPGQSLDVQPWTGYSQCNAQCRENGIQCTWDKYLGPGTFRFVVITAEGQRLASPSFTLP